MSDRRSSRKRKNRVADPGNASTAHYVGYVEDEESVEAIMRKFAELEKIQQELSSTIPNPKTTTDPLTDVDTDGVSTPRDLDAMELDPTAAALSSATANDLTEEQLEEVFKRTSAFTIQSATTTRYAEASADWDAAFFGDKLDVDFIPDATDDGEFEEEFIDDDDDGWYGRQGSRRGASSAPFGIPRGRVRRTVDREAVLARYREVRVQDQAGNIYTLKKKANLLDPSLPSYTRIPPAPIPSSWVRRIVPLEEYEADKAPEGSNVLEETIMAMEFSNLPGPFQAIYADPPLLLLDEPDHPDKIRMDEFAQLPLAKHIVPGGFLFVWTPKPLIAEMLRISTEWGFRYVENLCWVKLDADHRKHHEEVAVIGESKMTMLILRKEGDLELRHQRNADVVFDFVKPRIPGQLRDEKPAYVYSVIETLLPTAKWSPEKEAGSGFLELWAIHPKGRPGWTTVHEPLQ